MAATISDVARRAKVSKTTVSRIISQTPGFKYSKDTCDKVFLAAKALNYTPSAAAQLMRLKGIKLIGICVQPQNSFFSYNQIEKIASAFRKLNYYPVMIDLNESFELLGTPHLHRFDYLQGVVCLYDTQVKTVKELCNRYDKQIPIISLGADTKAGDFVKVVSTDHFQGGYLAGKHLCELGHKNITFFCYEEFQAFDKVKGFTAAAKEEGASCEVVKLSIDFPGTYEFGNQISEYLMSNLKYTATFCSNDEVAMGLISGLTKHGIKVPGNFSIVGYDNMNFAAYTNPSLTTVAQDVDQIAFSCAKILVSTIEATEIQYEFIPNVTKIPPKLIKRDSTSQMKNKVK